MKEQNHEDTKQRPGSVTRRVNNARDSLPGERNALPAGSLPDQVSGPQGDENREPAKPPTPPP
jgi:hypothetical protein